MAMHMRRVGAVQIRTRHISPVVKIEQRQRTGCADVCRGRVRHSAAPGSQRPAPAGSQPRAGAALIAARRPITSPLRSPVFNEAAARRRFAFTLERGEFGQNDPGAWAWGLVAPRPHLGTSPLRTTTFGFKPITFGAAALFSFAHFQLLEPKSRNAERSGGFWNLCEGRRLVRSQESSMHKDGKQIVETAVEARGGLLGRPVLLVLIVSCILAVAALVVTYSGA